MNQGKTVVQPRSLHIGGNRHPLMIPVHLNQVIHLLCYMLVGAVLKDQTLTMLDVVRN